MITQNNQKNQKTLNKESIIKNITNLQKKLKPSNFSIMGPTTPSSSNNQLTNVDHQSKTPYNNNKNPYQSNICYGDSSNYHPYANSQSTYTLNNTKRNNNQGHSIDHTKPLHNNISYGKNNSNNTNADSSSNSNSNSNTKNRYLLKTNSNYCYQRANINLNNPIGSSNIENNSLVNDNKQLNCYKNSSINDNYNKTNFLSNKVISTKNTSTTINNNNINNNENSPHTRSLSALYANKTNN